MNNTLGVVYSDLVSNIYIFVFILFNYYISFDLICVYVMSGWDKYPLFWDVRC